MDEIDKLLENHTGSEYYRFQKSEFYENVKNAIKELIKK